MQEIFDLDLLIAKIEDLCARNNIDVKNMLIQCGNKRQDVDNMKNGSKPSIEKILNIANFFDVSVDYLLSRTDEPHINTQTNTSSNVSNGGSGFQASHNGVVNISSSSEPDKLTARFMQRFEDLSYEEQFKVMAFVESLKKNQ